MRLIIDDTTRFFAVVGPAYIAERHADGDGPRHGSRCDSYEASTSTIPCSAGSWLNDDW